MNKSNTSRFDWKAYFGTLAIMLMIGCIVLARVYHKHSSASTSSATSALVEPALAQNGTSVSGTTSKEVVPGDTAHAPATSENSASRGEAKKNVAPPSGDRTTVSKPMSEAELTKFATLTIIDVPGPATAAAKTTETPRPAPTAPAPKPAPSPAPGNGLAVNRPVVVPVPSGPKAVPVTRPLPVPHTIHITQIAANDDSAKISWEPVPDAKDYRVVNLRSPFHPKYAGGASNTTVEMNGLDPVKGSKLVVEAVDAVGPYQDVDPYAKMDDSMEMVINGHGDPKNQPKAIATSDIFEVTCRPRTLTGEQAFFDRFQSEKPLVEKPVKDVDKNLIAMHTFSSQVCYQDYSNDKWDILLFDHQPEKTRLFFMAAHFMDILYDFHRTLRAKTVMVPKQTVKVPAGKVLHVTMEVDPYVSLNRTLGILVLPASDTITYPPAGGPYTQEGNLFDWQIAANAHDVQVFTDKVVRGANRSPDSKYDANRWKQQSAGGPMGGGLNGGEEDLDRRHRFDLYLSANRYVIAEEGKVVNDIPLSRIYAGPPGNVYDDTLTWFNTKPLKVAFYHYLYHSAADEIYLKRGEISPRPDYWLDHRPDSDERHWDNMGFEVLDHFPND